jgi:hypothetical protein
MNNFKVDDRVMVLEDEACGAGVKMGDMGTITKVYDAEMYVRMDKPILTYWFSSDTVKLIGRGQKAFL